MAKQKAPTRSFNTVKHSNRDKRIKRKQNQRIVLLSIFLVVILLVISMLSFCVLLVVDFFKGNQPDTPPVNDPDNGQNPAPPAEVVYVALPQLNSEMSKGELIIINGSHTYDPSKAENLQVIHGSQPKSDLGYDIYSVGNPAWKLNATALDALNQMLQTYYNASDNDTDIKVGSAYRTAQEQESFSTPVGQSDHHSGYCLTLKTAAGYLHQNHWIYENCHKYGFVVRYPEGKEAITGVSDYGWCFRYVGVAHATYMKANNLCMEEYVSLLQQNYQNGTNLTFTGADGNQYKVYYTPASTSDTLTTLQVPSNYEYSISGDNMGGFIVTVNLSKPITPSAE